MSKTDLKNDAALRTRISDVEKLLAEARAQITNSENEMDSFSYSVSHDLRAPLRAIEGFSKILLEDYAKGLDSEGKRFLDYVQVNAQHMSRLIDDLLAYHRLGQARLSKGVVDMNELVRTVVAELKVTHQPADCDFTIEALAPAFGDAAQLKQAFAQIITNAIQFRAPGRKLRVKIRSETCPNETVYSVGDDGQGFDMQYADKLFKVFQKLQKSEAHQGNGIGLAMVRRIITRHGGRVWADAKPNEGATFFLTLPLENVS